MGYRELFFSYTPSLRGKYQCSCCKGWFPKSQIDVDHRISKRMGGTDDIWNLQAMCRHCNRSKGKNSTNGEILHTVAAGAVNGLLREGPSGVVVNLTRLGSSVAKRKVCDAVGIKYKR